jgi:arylsulfatase A-like enzyme
MGNVELRSSAGLSAPLSPEIAGLAKILSGAGYETAYFGKWHLGGNPSEHGFQSSMPDSGTPLEGTLKFLENRKGSQAGRRPLLLFVSWLSPHQIYAVNDSRATDVAGDSASLATIPLPANLRDNLQGKPFPQVHFLKEDQGKPFQNYRPEEWRRYISFYNRLVAQVDREIGQVVRAVREESANSLIFFSSDHGDLGGAHGLPFKGPAMYEELVRVPLLFSWPGRLKPGVTRELVSNIDVLPTICELLSLPVPDGVDGISLASILLGRNRELRRDALFGEYYGKQNWRVPIRMVRTRDWKYVRYVKYGEELYDLQSDPGELRNLAAAPTAAGRRKELSSRLDRWIAQTKDPFPQLTVTDRSGRVLQ